MLTEEVTEAVVALGSQQPSSAELDLWARRGRDLCAVRQAVSVSNIVRADMLCTKPACCIALILNPLALCPPSCSQLFWPMPYFSALTWVQGAESVPFTGASPALLYPRLAEGYEEVGGQACCA